MAHSDSGNSFRYDKEQGKQIVQNARDKVTERNRNECMPENDSLTDDKGQEIISKFIATFNTDDRLDRSKPCAGCGADTTIAETAP